MNYFVYVKDIIGVETDLKDFHWNFGSSAPEASYQAYAKCLIKIRLRICKDSRVVRDVIDENADQRFRHFHVKENEIVLFRRLGRMALGYRMSIDENDNSIDVTVGKNYYRYIKYKIMTLHPIWYVLYDAVSCLLLKNGLMVLYGSAVATGSDGANVFMGAPGIGKTTTAIRLCREEGWKMISEDLIITDGQKAWSVPYTNTYRGACDKEGIPFVEDERRIDRVVILERGDHAEVTSKEILLKKATLLNRYGVQYYSSPTMMAYDYFYPDTSRLSLDTLASTERRILGDVLSKENVRVLRAAEPSSFLPMYLNTEETR